LEHKLRPAYGKYISDLFKHLLHFDKVTSLPQLSKPYDNRVQPFYF